MELLQTDAASVKNRRYHVLQISTYDAWLPQPAARQASSSDSAAAMWRLDRQSGDQQLEWETDPTADVPTVVLCLRNR